MIKKFFSILIFCFTILTPAFAFSDVLVDFWAYDKIDQMYKSGIISGFEDGTFRPNDTITREQSAAILSNFFEISMPDEIKAFEDVQSGYWSEPYNNMVSPFMPTDEVDGKFYFRPQDFATRVEIAETVSKIIGLKAEEDNLEILNNFNDKDEFLEEDKEYIALVANNKIMVGDDKSEFRPNDTITRAEFCALIYNIYMIKNDLKVEEKTVMTINGENISTTDFNIYFGLQKKVYEAMFGGPSIWAEEVDGVTLYEVVKEATKEGIISEKVRVQKAREFGIELTEEAKTEVWEYANSDVGLEICEFYGITVDELYNINSDGKLIYELARFIYESKEHKGHAHDDINSPIEIILYNARHILLSYEGLNEAEKAKVKEEADSLLKRVLNGEDFATLANQYSEDPGSNQNGGLYENVTLGEFVPEFENAAISLNDGEIYPTLVESDFGYHIIKLDKLIKTTRELTEEEKQEIMSIELEEISKEWIKNAVIEINEEVYKSL